MESKAKQNGGLSIEYKISANEIINLFKGRNNTICLYTSFRDTKREQPSFYHCHRNFMTKNQCIDLMKNLAILQNYLQIQDNETDRMTYHLQVSDIERITIFTGKDKKVGLFTSNEDASGKLFKSGYFFMDHNQCTAFSQKLQIMINSCE